MQDCHSTPTQLSLRSWFNLPIRSRWRCSWRVLIKIAATWKVSRLLLFLKRGIHCNLTLLFGKHRLLLCRNASPWFLFCGTYSWLVQKRYDAILMHLQKIQVCFSDWNLQLLQKSLQDWSDGCQFRNVGEITELAGCDLLTIAPSLLAELHQQWVICHASWIQKRS